MSKIITSLIHFPFVFFQWGLIVVLFDDPLCILTLVWWQNGEDVRQDQLAVHMVSLMDRQLKEAGLDLKLKVRTDE